MRASQQLAYISLVAVMAMDIATNVRLVHLTAMHALHVTKHTEARRYSLNASGK